MSLGHSLEVLDYPESISSRSYAISYDAERSRNVSHQVRQDGRRLINETYNESWWNKHDKCVDKISLTKSNTSSSVSSDGRISDRLDEIDKWRKTLEYSIQDVDREIQAIQSAKENCERYLEHMRSPLGLSFSLFEGRMRNMFFLLDISLENYVTRNGRKAIDNVDDEAERELKKVKSPSSRAHGSAQ